MLVYANKSLWGNANNCIVWNNTEMLILGEGLYFSKYILLFNKHYEVHMHKFAKSVSEIEILAFGAKQLWLYSYINSGLAITFCLFVEMKYLCLLMLGFRFWLPYTVCYKTLVLRISVPTQIRSLTGKSSYNMVEVNLITNGHFSFFRKQQKKVAAEVRVCIPPSLLLAIFSQTFLASCFLKYWVRRFLCFKAFHAQLIKQTHTLFVYPFHAMSEKH